MPGSKPMTGLRGLIYHPEPANVYVQSPGYIARSSEQFLVALQREMDICEREISDQIERQVFSPQSWGRTVSPFKHWDANSTVAPRFTTVQSGVRRRVRRLRNRLAEPQYRVREAWGILRHGVPQDWD